MQILSDPSFLCVCFSSYPALQRDIQPLKTGSSLSFVRTVLKGTLSLLRRSERRLESVMSSWVTFAAGTAKSGGWFLSATHGLHTAMMFAVLRDPGNRYPSVWDSETDPFFCASCLDGSVLNLFMYCVYFCILV